MSERFELSNVKSNEQDKRNKLSVFLRIGFEESVGVMIRSIDSMKQ